MGQIDNARSFELVAGEAKVLVNSVKNLKTIKGRSA